MRTAIPIRKSLCGAILLALLAGDALAAAPDFPQRPIRVIVPSLAGGPPDLLIRMLSPKLVASLGQQLVVDNRAGAGGIIGTAAVAKAAPDGYTWLFTTASHVNTPPFNKNVPFDPVRDFSHVSLVAQNFGQALVVPPSSPAKTVTELRDRAAASGQAQLCFGRHRHGEPYPRRSDEGDDRNRHRRRAIQGHG